MSGDDTSRAILLPLVAHDFDLREVMDAVGDWAHLRWVLQDAWLNGISTAGWEHAEKESEQQGGLPITWTEMARLADDCLQVIDGRFTGYDANGQPVLQFLAVDSSYWTVWARDDETLARIRVAFPHAEPYYGPTPEPV